jgi:heptosyltransferase-2
VQRLVIVAPNWLGDAVMALPAIADVRNGSPGVQIAVAARASIAPLFSLVRTVDDVIVLPRSGAGSLDSYDTAILLPNSFHSALRVARAGVRERWGYRTDWRGLLLTRSINRPHGRLHQVEYYQQLVRLLGFSNGLSAPQIEVSDDLRGVGRRSLLNGGWDGRSALVAVAPGAAYGSAKRWPPAAFADLIAGLADDGVTAVVVGASADRATTREVVRELRGRATLIDLVDRTDIPGLAGVLVHCRALVANDSGALHLAAAVGINVAGVFGPTDDRLTSPRAKSHEALAKTLTHHTWCRPCALRECPLDHACMNGVGASDVHAATRQML